MGASCLKGREWREGVTRQFQGGKFPPLPPPKGVGNPRAPVPLYETLRIETQVRQVICVLRAGELISPKQGDKEIRALKQ